MKLCSVGTELFHADERRDRHDEANRRFSQYCQRAYKLVSFCYTERKSCLFPDKYKTHKYSVGRMYGL